MYIRAKKLLRSYKGTKCASTDRASRNKNSEQSAYNQIRSAILFSAYQPGLSCFFLKKEVSDFFLRSLFLCFGFCTVYTVPLYKALIIEVDQCSHLGKGCRCFDYW